jgi:hypothetical protein
MRLVRLARGEKAISKRTIEFRQGDKTLLVEVKEEAPRGDQLSSRGARSIGTMLLPSGEATVHAAAGPRDPHFWTVSTL